MIVFTFYYWQIIDSVRRGWRYLTQTTFSILISVLPQASAQLEIPLHKDPLEADAQDPSISWVTIDLSELNFWPSKKSQRNL
jgi:hypothetical protein